MVEALARRAGCDEVINSNSTRQDRLVIFPMWWRMLNSIILTGTI